MSRFSKTVIVLLMLAAAVYYWLLVDRGPAGAPIRPIDLAALRRAGDIMPGNKPVSLEYAVVATRKVPGAVLAAGTGLRKINSGVLAWRIEDGRGGIVIDSGFSAADAQRIGFDHFDKRAESIVGRWMDGANLILFTHEHIDHVGGFLDHHGFAAIAAKTVLTEPMVQGMTALWRENAQSLPAPRKLAPVEAVAPGVVLIQTPGHTPASQMIYVHLANGREYLFTGDTASLANNVIKARPRSRLLTDWMVREDRSATIGWIKGLNALLARDQTVVIIPSHDPDWIAATAPRDGFALAPSLRPAPEPKRIMRSN